jgi:hypothetical protein
MHAVFFLTCSAVLAKITDLYYSRNEQYMRRIMDKIRY